jgi:hypothetical protein
MAPFLLLRAKMLFAETTHFGCLDHVISARGQDGRATAHPCATRARRGDRRGRSVGREGDHAAKKDDAAQ